MTFPGKGRADYLELGDWNAVCYQCGRKRKASQLRRHWQGYYVCKEHWEPRHPQDFARGLPDKQTPPWVQPMPADVFAAFCTPQGVTAIANYGVADCMICDFVSPIFDPTVSTDVEPCLPVIFLEDAGVGVEQVLTGCQALVVESKLIVEGVIGIT